MLFWGKICIDGSGKKKRNEEEKNRKKNREGKHGRKKNKNNNKIIKIIIKTADSQIKNSVNRSFL